MLFPIKLFGIFTSERDVLNIVYSFLPILIFSFVTAGIRHTLSSLISGSGNKKINLAVALLDAVVARISFAVIFGVLLDLGYMGLWLGTALAELVPIFIGLAFYFFGSWKKDKGKSEIQI
jgi:Na+-driven multidrug efflux pump